MNQVYIVYVRTERWEWPYIAVGTPEEVEAVERSLTDSGSYLLVNWEEVHFEASSGWTPKDPLHFVLEGVFAFSLGVFTSRAEAEEYVKLQDPTAMIEIASERIGSRWGSPPNSLE